MNFHGFSKDLNCYKGTKKDGLKNRLFVIKNYLKTGALSFTS